MMIVTASASVCHSFSKIHSPFYIVCILLLGVDPTHSYCALFYNLWHANICVFSELKVYDVVVVCSACIYKPFLHAHKQPFSMLSGRGMVLATVQVIDFGPEAEVDLHLMTGLEDGKNFYIQIKYVYLVNV